MKKIILYISILPILILGSCNDFLDKDLYTFEDEKYWISEPNLRAFAQAFYPRYFSGYAQDFTEFGGYFSGGIYTDDYLMANNRDDKHYFPTTRDKATGGWDTHYEYVRKANIMLKRIPTMDLPEESKLHWQAVARLFRAVTYSRLVEDYGDVPYIDIAVDPNDVATLYKPRDSRVMVVDKILEDFQYAIANIKTDDGLLQANKYLAGAMMSRWMLYHGTWLKYHGTTVGPSSKAVDNATLKRYFEGAIEGAKVVMDGPFSIANTYNQLFASADLKGNPEVIFYREYVETIFPNALMAYNAKEDQTQGGVTQATVDAYLCDDGLPIGQSPKYKGAADPRIKAVFENRDPRLYQTIVDSVRVTNGGHKASSITGYVTKKFLNETWLKENSPYITGQKSIADAPDVRFAEVLLNYIESRYEVSTVGGAALNQQDFDLSINKLRSRNLTKWGDSQAKTMPTVTLSGSNLMVNGVMINDPARDPNVDPVAWEIRRERRVELMMEGFRNSDLNRWAKYEYLVDASGDTPKTSLLGSWITQADYPEMIIGEKIVDGKPVKGVNVYNPTGDPTVEGYIYPLALVDKAGKPLFPARKFVKGSLDSERNYLRAIPHTQITLYERNGHILEQNPGW